MAGNVFVNMYVTLISFGRWTLDRVLPRYKNDVALECYDLGILRLDEMAKEQREFVEAEVGKRNPPDEEEVVEEIPDEEEVDEEIPVEDEPEQKADDDTTVEDTPEEEVTPAESDPSV